MMNAVIPIYVDSVSATPMSDGWRVEVKSKLFGKARIQYIGNCRIRRNVCQEEAEEIAIKKMKDSLILHSKANWVITQTIEKYGEARKELFRDFVILLRRRYGKDYMFNKYALIEIVAKLNLPPFPA